MICGVAIYLIKGARYESVRQKCTITGQYFNSETNYAMDRNDALFWCLRLFIQTKIMGIIAGGLIRSYPTALRDRFLRPNEYPSNYIILNKSQIEQNYSQCRMNLTQIRFSGRRL